MIYEFVLVVTLTMVKPEGVGVDTLKIEEFRSERACRKAAEKIKTEIRGGRVEAVCIGK